jgi:zinc transport system permease protein
MMGLSVFFCILFTSGGLALSYGPGLPTGATIILVSGAAYLGVAFFSRTMKIRRQAPGQGR